MSRQVNEIAAEISNAMRDMKPSPWIPMARPFVDALLNVRSFKDFYGIDSAIYIGRMFLENSVMWKGEQAIRIKAEIRQLIQEAEVHANT